ncbi:dynamin family protein [Aliarcobacter cryaerophilus]|uniref:dynamin family protein n=1 Tax=Aliarcobacter cryaerophilus TaxID=28198 RepID=UPI0021B1ECD2|nr:dynamin family protein [Aliarcobacter cryaerophilus]MCT7506985.1 dynamin family protein [Aliarcobacter cryaerophilus]
MKNNIDKQQYKIAVVANMSAGKSTFINALFGDSILPAYSHATTDCPIYIYSDDNPENDKAIVEFTDDKPTIELAKEDVPKEIKFYAQKDDDSLDNKYKNVKRIDLHWDFHVLQNSQKYDKKFILIDTPGPNNTDEHAFKHSDITRNIIINEADMVLYLFDYGQIDANLESSENNLWGLIKQRKEQDPNFEVFFVINKIDKAFEDNKKIPNIISSSSKDEFYTNIKKHWLYHEEIAISKIKNSAIKYGFNSPKIFTVSSKFIEYYRNKKNLNFDHLDDIDEFMKFFKNIFGNNWDIKFHDYLGYKIIEKELKKHLNIDEQIFKPIKRKKIKYKKK